MAGNSENDGAEESSLRHENAPRRASGAPADPHSCQGERARKVDRDTVRQCGTSFSVAPQYCCNFLAAAAVFEVRAC